MIYLVSLFSYYISVKHSNEWIELIKHLGSCRCDVTSQCPRDPEYGGYQTGVVVLDKIDVDVWVYLGERGEGVNFRGREGIIHLQRRGISCEEGHKVNPYIF